MEYIKVGNIANTHALKGELRIVSSFEYKDQVFVVGKHLLIGRFKEEQIIESYRKHKNYDMVKFEKFNSIMEVTKYKGEPIYILKKDLVLGENDILIEEITNMEAVFNNNVIGLIEEYRNDNGNKLVRVNEKYIPYNNDFIEKIDKTNKKIYFKNIDSFL